MADILRDRVITEKSNKCNLLNCSQLDLLMAGQVFALKDLRTNAAIGRFMAFDYKGKAHLFSYDEDQGLNKGQLFHGRITDRPCDEPIENLHLDDQVLILESEKLQKSSF